MKKPKYVVDSVSYESEIYKYYLQRYRLWRLYDGGVWMDKESWFSVTPEILSEYLSNRIGYQGIILDLFAGTGGNSIQFAKMGNYVISCDKDYKKIECLKNNSKIYNVDKNIDTIIGDYQHFKFFKNSIDVVFLSPPWV